MSQIIKTYTGLFFLLLQSMTGMGIVAASTVAGAAQNYHAQVITQVECSNFNEAVMEECVRQAEEQGYGLKITPLVYDERNQVRMAEVVLEYQYAVPLLELVSEKEICGFAR